MNRNYFGWLQLWCTTSSLLQAWSKAPVAVIFLCSNVPIYGSRRQFNHTRLIFIKYEHFSSITIFNTLILKWVKSTISTYIRNRSTHSLHSKYYTALIKVLQCITFVIHFSIIANAFFKYLDLCIMSNWLIRMRSWGKRLDNDNSVLCFILNLLHPHRYEDLLNRIYKTYRDPGLSPLVSGDWVVPLLVCDIFETLLLLLTVL